MAETNLLAELSAVAGVDEEARRLLEALDGPDVRLGAGPGSSGGTGSRDLLRRAWRWTRTEVHVLLCTDDPRYSSERMQLRAASKPTVSMLTAVLIQQFGFEVGTAGSMAALALLLPLRMGIGAWCRAYAAGEDESGSALLRGEREALVEVGNLVTMLDSSEPNEQVWAAYRLAEVKHQPSIVIPRVLRLIEHAEPYVRERAAMVIGMYEAEAAGADVFLTRLLSDQDRQVRYSASKSLTQVPPSSAGIVSRFLSALEHENDESIRENIVEAIGLQGPAASDALPSLELMRVREEEKYGRGSHVSRLHRAVTKAQGRITGRSN